MRKVAVLGVGMTKFAKYPDTSLKELSRIATWAAIKDVGIDPREIEIIYFGNSLAGLITGQESIRGQTVFREMGLVGKPIINVENACASASTAFFGAWMAVASGYADVALALGSEKLFCGDTVKSINALATCSDTEVEGRMGFQFSAHYAMKLRRHMSKYGLTREQMAKVTVKNHHNGSLNPYAQYQNEVTIEEVLNSRMIADPITLFMTAPMGDGAAAAILTSVKKARQFTTKPVYLAATVLQSSAVRDIRKPDEPDVSEICAIQAYEKAGIGPEDIEVAEVHDAMAPGEILQYENLHFCPKGEGGKMIDEGRTQLTGEIPVNPSGGLSARGHPVGATGLAQIAEIVWQLRGQAEKRQIKPKVKVGLVQNGGGAIAGEPASMTVHILKR